MSEDDVIEISGLEVWCQIGVTDAERAQPQRLLIDVTLKPSAPFDSFDDDLARTVDYSAVARLLTNAAASHPRRLIETLTADLVQEILTTFPVREARVRTRKFVLSNAQWVAVTHCSQSA